MKRIFTVLSLAACLSVAGASSLLAQGRGSAAGRGLGNAAGGAAAAGQGMGRASESMSRSSQSMGGTATGVSRSATGLQRSSSAMDRGMRPQAVGAMGNQPAMNQDRIADRRFEQAEHLRSISERNGNEALLNTAGRMEANAVTNQQRQLPQPTGVAGDVIVPEAASAPTYSAIAPATRASSNAKRGLWFRSR
jgi:hypothetical protein